MSTEQDNAPAIEIHELRRRYGRTDAVDGLNLRVQPGRCYGFFGRNGAGKTTTIKTLMGMVRATSGEARVLGARVGQSPRGGSRAPPRRLRW